MNNERGMNGLNGVNNGYVEGGSSEHFYGNVENKPNNNNNHNNQNGIGRPSRHIGGFVIPPSGNMRGQYGNVGQQPAPQFMGQDNLPYQGMGGAMTPSQVICNALTQYGSNQVSTDDVPVSIAVLKLYMDNHTSNNIHINSSFNIAYNLDANSLANRFQSFMHSHLVTLLTISDIDDATRTLYLDKLLNDMNSELYRNNAASAEEVAGLVVGTPKVYGVEICDTHKLNKGLYLAANHMELLSAYVTKNIILNHYSDKLMADIQVLEVLEHILGEDDIRHMITNVVSYVGYEHVPFMNSPTPADIISKLKASIASSREIVKKLSSVDYVKLDTQSLDKLTNQITKTSTTI